MDANASLLAPADPGTARETAPTDRPPQPTSQLHEVKLDAADEKTSLHEELNLNDDGPEGLRPTERTDARRDRPPRHSDPLYRADQVDQDEKVTPHHAVTVTDGAESSGSGEDGQLLVAGSYSLRAGQSYASRDGGEGGHRDDDDLEQHPESNGEDGEDGEALQQQPEDGGQESAGEAEAAGDSSGSEQPKDQVQRKRRNRLPTGRVHGGQGSYKCNECQRCFKRKNDLAKHVKTHTGKRSYECDICHKRYSSQGNLVTHVRTHTGEKPYECDFCNKHFAQKGDLAKHVRTHSGEKPFECGTCHKRFSRKYILDIHIKTHTGERPYECVICHKRFIN
ncbi:zinc finger protein 157-like [Frankliniella occidentalis]|uniref:Zinc finger protein 157-like n=1 Tax=Frankliniella occidentalis TaxID=133901 RepID=A0A9C6X712_FRAOC|nr:zinc finger protein 157-like [Frankliniella occidentalis]